MPFEAVQRLHPASLLFSVGSAARRLLLPGIVVLLFSRGSNAELWLMPFFLFAVLGAVVKYLSFRYRFGDGELIIREGIVTRKERHIPYLRVQNIDLVRNPLHRWLGVAEVRLETAGGEKPEAVMRVLSLDAIEDMRRRVFSGRERSAETADAAAEPELARDESAVRSLLRLGSREVFLYGIISNRGMVVVAAAFGAAWQFGLWERWGEQPWKRLSDRLPAPEWLEGPLAIALAGFVGIVVVLVLLRLLSVALAVLRLHGFRLERRGEDLRAEYGLLTRVTKTIPRHRIQVLTSVETPLHRWFGRMAVRAETAGGIGSEEGGSADRLELIPLLPRERLFGLLQELLPGVELSATDWQPIADRATGRLFRRSLALFLPAVAAAALLVDAWVAAAVVPLVALAWVRARLYARHTAYAIVGDAVAYRSGWWTRRMSVARFGKLQVVQLSESPFDRRHRMAALRIDTAGGGRTGHPISIRFLEAVTAKTLMQRLHCEAASTTFRW